MLVEIDNTSTCLSVVSRDIDRRSVGGDRVEMMAACPPYPFDYLGWVLTKKKSRWPP